MEKNSGIKTYALHVMTEDIYKNINNLMSCNLENGTVPYLNENPLPQDMNIVNGRHLGDINKVQLELKAAKIGAKSLKWIYGADAALIGLELKTKENALTEFQKSKNILKDFDTEPIIGFANVRRDISKSAQSVTNVSNIAAEGMKIDAQCIYLLEQFSEKSVQRALKLTRLEENLELRGNPVARKQKRIIAQNMIKNISEYDSGIRETETRENKRKNIAFNCKDKNVLSKISETFNFLSKNYDQNQKYIFQAINGYYIKQETGLNLRKSLSDEQQKNLVAALKNAIGTDSPKLAHTLSDCFFYSERMTHYHFSHDRIYTQNDYAKKLSVMSPKAAEFQPKEIDSIADERTIKQLRDREREFKPRQPNHRLGGY